MGSSSLAGMLEVASPRQALYWHLTSNHYPPLPSALVPIAERVIRYAKRGKWDARINLGGVCRFRGGKYAPVSECIRAWHLEQFVEGGD